MRPIRFFDRILPVLLTVKERFGYDYEIVFAVDPSTDGTEQRILDARARNNAVKLISFSRRFGQQPSMLAGIFHCRGDACIVIDVDLQDPPELIVDMMAKHVNEGYDVVNAIRLKRHGEPLIKRALTHVGTIS